MITFVLNYISKARYNKAGISLCTFTMLLTISCAQRNIGQSLYYNLEKVNAEILKKWQFETNTSKDLPYPYITAIPNVSFMFYWDTYFINKGLIVTNNVNIAKHNTLNILNVVDRYGFMGNAAVTSWGMNRSQPPYLSMMVRDIYEKDKDLAFLKYAYPILVKEHSFWTGRMLNTALLIEDHRTLIDGLQRFSHHATNNQLIELYNEIAGRVGLDKNLSDEVKVKITSNYAAEAESGMDFTSRFENKCTEFIPLDLNVLLYSLEINLEWIKNVIQLPQQPDWIKMAIKRKALINRFCWDEKNGLYYDYNFKSKQHSKIAAVTTFQPLSAGMASARQARRVIAHLHFFKTNYGLTTTKIGTIDTKYQWGSNSIWAPMQIIAVEGMLRYGFKKQAKDLIDNYLNLVAKNYYEPLSSKKNTHIVRKPGEIYEKYKFDGSINDDEYLAAKMMGWTAGTYNYLYALRKNL